MVQKLPFALEAAWSNETEVQVTEQKKSDLLVKQAPQWLEKSR